MKNVKVISSIVLTSLIRTEVTLKWYKKGYRIIGIKKTNLVKA